MSEFCEHETFRDICGICHRDKLITALRAENEKLRAALEQIAGYRMKGKSDADIARSALEEKQ